MWAKCVKRFSSKLGSGDGIKTNSRCDAASGADDTDQQGVFEEDKQRQRELEEEYTRIHRLLESAPSSLVMSRQNAIDDGRFWRRREMSASANNQLSRKPSRRASTGAPVYADATCATTSPQFRSSPSQREGTGKFRLPLSRSSSFAASSIPSSRSLPYVSETTFGNEEVSMDCRCADKIVNMTSRLVRKDSSGSKASLRTQPLRLHRSCGNGDGIADFGDGGSRGSLFSFEHAMTTDNSGKKHHQSPQCQQHRSMKSGPGHMITSLLSSATSRSAIPDGTVLKSAGKLAGRTSGAACIDVKPSPRPASASSGNSVLLRIYS